MSYLLFLLSCWWPAMTGSAGLPPAAPSVIVAVCDSIPPLNRQIHQYVISRIKKKVGRGECWDLAAEALNTHQAKWNGKYTFGVRVDYQTECVFPGDILQFENVVITSKSNAGVYKEHMAHHTAIVHAVNAPGEYVIAHQNTSFSGRKVGLSEINLNHITKGRVMVYRPTR